MRSVNAFCDRLKASCEATPHSHDSTIYRTFMDSERYMIDFADEFTAEGWLQFDTDQDAHYFGVWVNPIAFRTLTYAEGDWALVECGNRDNYNAQIRDMIGFYDEGRICSALGADGSWTTYRQDRESFILQ